MKGLGKDLGIDLGTANTLVYVKGKGIVIREPSVIAVNKDTKEVLAVGDEAKLMLGKTPGNIIAIRPMKDGVIADYTYTQHMLKYFIQKACSNKSFFKPKIIVCVPSCITEVEKRAIEDSVINAGAKEAYLIEEPMAASMGAGLAVEDPIGTMVVDIGGGTSEVAVISLGGIVTSVSLKIAGDYFDNAIVQYIKRTQNIMIGDRTAEQIKIQIGSAYSMPEEKAMEINGRHLVTGLPKKIVITSDQIREALSDSVMTIVDCIKNTLEKTPPELAADIMERGIMLTGGGAMLNGIDTLITEETGIITHIAENPLDCVTLGTAHVLDQINSLRKVLSTSKRWLKNSSTTNIL